MKVKKYQEPDDPIEQIVPVVPLTNLSRSQIKRNAIGNARDEDFADDYINSRISVGGNRRWQKRYHDRHFNRERNRIAKEKERLERERQVAEMMSNHDWFYRSIGGRKPEHPASVHGRQYVQPLVNAAVWGIGGAMGAANPITTTFAPELLQWAGHAAKVMMNPASAETMAGTFLGTAADSYLTVTGLQRNSELLNNWQNGNFNWSDLPEFGLNILGVFPYVKAADTAFDAARTANIFKGTSHTVPMAKGDPGLAQTYINSAGNAMEPVQVNPRVASIYNQQISGKLANQNISKLTPEELSGDPKGVRNNVRSKQSIEGAKELKKFYDSNISINSETINNSSFPESVLKARQVQSGIPIEKVLDPQTINMKRFASTLSTVDDLFKPYKLNNGAEMESVYVTEFRRYLSDLGSPVTALSTDEIAKILTHNKTHIQKDLTGALKDKILWHTTPKVFDRFNWKKYIGSTTNNTGLYGSGNYFSFNAPSEYGQNPIHMPMVINNVKQIIPRGTKKLDISKINPLPDNFIGIGPNTGSTQNFFRAASGLSESQYSDNIPEIVISRDTGIKSLFPHPDRFVRNPDGTVSFTPTDWNDPRFNFKYGGKIKNDN